MEHAPSATPSAFSYFGGVGRGQLQVFVSALVASPVVFVDTTSPQTIPGPLPVAILVALALVHAAFDVGAALLRLLDDRGILTIVLVDPTRPEQPRPAPPPDDPAAIEERKRLARDLHDSIKQQLYRIRLGLATAKARWTDDPSGAMTAIDDSERGAAEAIAEVNALLQRLAPMPLAKAGLVEALRDQAEALGYRAGVEVHVEIGALPPDDRLPAGTGEALFRVAQEALSNVARHARARNVWLRLRTDRDEAVVLEIADDGQGFDAATVAAGMGLANIRERIEAIGGVDAVLGTPGGGTSVRVAVPLVDLLAALEQNPTQELVDALMGQAVLAACVMVAGIVWTGSVAMSLVADWALDLGAWTNAAMPLLGAVVGLGVAWVSHIYYLRMVRRAEELSDSPAETAILRRQATASGWLMGSLGLVALLSYPGDGPLTEWMSIVRPGWIVAIAGLALVGTALGWWRLYRLRVQLLVAVAGLDPLRAWAKFKHYARRQPPYRFVLLVITLLLFIVFFRLYGQIAYDETIDIRGRMLTGFVVLNQACLAATLIATNRHHKRWETILRRRYKAARP